MPKKSTKKPTPCKCVEQANEQLAEHGVRLASRIKITFSESVGELTSHSPIIATEWIDKPKRGKRLPPVLCAYCPFCGQKKESEASDE